MKYSYNWLQKHIEEKLPAPEALKETIIFHAFEVESFEEKNEDTIFDIKVLPDRAGDCLSHYGMAREIAGLLGLTLKKAEHTLPEIPLLLPVEVKSDLVRRYMAIRIDGVKVGPSPEWLKQSLEAVGARSINNIVDATNYVLLDSGQPTHAFDAAKIDGGIVVRSAHEGETIITLSEESKTLTSDMVVIADYVGALAIAGVKGGKTAEIDTTSTSIILEIANFDPVAVRKTARTLNLATDASKRFENNLSPEVAHTAAMQLVALIRDIAGGEVTGVHDMYPTPYVPRTLSFDVEHITRILGSSITGQMIAEVFDRYQYDYTFTEGTFVFTIPSWRADITGAHDMAEEIGRAMGYDVIVPQPLPIVGDVRHSEVYRSIEAAKAWLVHDGYSEVMTYTFCAKGEIEIVRGAKGKSALRTNLSDGLKASYEVNKLNAPLLGLSEIKLFEIGTVFFADKEEVHIATVDKGMVKETTLEAYIAEHAIVLEGTSLDVAPVSTVFVPWSVYPFIARDIAVWVAHEDDKVRLETILDTFAKEYCVRPPVLFDQFVKDGRTSLAYRLVFQAYDKTLTESEVEAWFAVLTKQVTAEAVFEIR